MLPGTTDIDEDSETRRKRKQRAVLSCRTCRKRKLKCDREVPCDRCINGGIGCVYGNETQDFVHDDSNHGHQTKRVRKTLGQPTPISECSTVPSPVSLETSSNVIVQRLEQRIATLESHISSLHTRSEACPPPNALSADVVEESLQGLFKGRDYRTFYYGPTNHMLIVAHFPDLRPFMKRIFINSTLARLRQNIGKLEDKNRINKANDRVVSVANLRSLLPDRSTVDKVIKEYFDTFETSYRILHAPEFYARYRSYWDAARAPDSEMDAIVLAILACTLCISTLDNTRYDINGSTFRAKAIVWIKACEAWLKLQSNKHKSLATIQVRCLRLLALSTTCAKTKEYYQEVQQVMAFMRSSGMHRDPSILDSRCSVFYGEMRRRLWATVMELELQASVDKGIPSILSGMEYDCRPPRNVHDSELHAEMKQLPQSHPLSIFTDTAFLHCSMLSIPLRIKLCAQVNSLHSCKYFQDTLENSKDVQNALDRLPNWTEKHSLHASTLLDLQLRQFLVILHTPKALHTLIPSNRYSIFTALEASDTMIKKHMKLMEAKNFALCCIRSDYLRAALLICHITYHASITKDSIVMRVAKSVFDEIMEDTFQLLEERSLRPGRGDHQYWYLSAACSLVSIQFEPQRTQLLEREACDRVCRLLYKVLSLQDDPLEVSLAREVILGDTTLSSTPAPAPVPELQNLSVDTSSFPSHADSFLIAGPQLDPFGNDASADSAWMLNDLWLDDFPTIEGNNNVDYQFLRNVG